jgi:nitrite reductase/ring-hydroxylating ferredoxin subunit
MGSTNEETGTTRRAVLAGAGATGVAVTLGACDSDKPAASSGAIKTGDIPVGGGKVYDDQKVVVTQPAAGQFKAFTAVCTHQGCTVGMVSDNVILCPCHGSQFSATDGSVTRGPAATPLASKTVSVSGDTITVS